MPLWTIDSDRFKFIITAIMAVESICKNLVESNEYIPTSCIRTHKHTTTEKEEVESNAITIFSLFQCIFDSLLCQ